MVVEAVAPLDHDSLGLSSVLEVVAGQDFPFQAGEERFRAGVDAPILRNPSGDQFCWGRFGDGDGVEGWQEVVDLADEVALQTTDDLAFGQTLGGASGDVGDGRFVPAHPNDDGLYEFERGIARSYC